MANVLLAFNNRVNSATLGGGSWLAGLPVNNLKNEVQGVVARSTNLALASTKFTVDFGAEKLVRTFALINHNLGLDAKVRIRASEDSASMLTNVLYDSGWVEAWPAVYNSLDLPWEAENFWSGQYTDEERAGYNWTFINSAPYTIAPRYLLIEIDDATNTNGYVQIGRAFFGDAWQPSSNFSFGSGIGWEDPSEISEALSGAEYADKRAKRRVARFNTDSLTEDEALAFAFEIQRRVGITDEVIYQYDPDDTAHSLRRWFCGRLGQLDQITHPTLSVHAAAWEIRERL